MLFFKHHCHHHQSWLSFTATLYLAIFYSETIMQSELNESVQIKRIAWKFVLLFFAVLGDPQTKITNTTPSYYPKYEIKSMRPFLRTIHWNPVATAFITTSWAIADWQSVFSHKNLLGSEPEKLPVFPHQFWSICKSNSTMITGINARWGRQHCQQHHYQYQLNDHHQQ